MGVGNVLCIGEALFDLTESTAAGWPGPAYLPHAGGSSFNVAVGVARLGVGATFAGSFADDLLGERLRGFLRDEAVSIIAPPPAPALTAVSIMSLDNAEPRYSFYASPASYGFLRASDIPATVLDRADVIHAGSIALLEPTTRAAVLHAFRSGRGITTLDPNARPGLIADRASYLREFEELVGLADLVKLSAEDAEYLYPGWTATAVAEALLGRGCSVVVVTAAAAGAQLWTRDFHVVVPIATGAPVVDTTGGGDSVMAAIISRLAVSGLPLDRDAWRELLGFAMAVAAVTCSRAGGANAMPTAADLMAGSAPTR